MSVRKQMDIHSNKVKSQADKDIFVQFLHKLSSDMDSQSEDNFLVLPYFIFIMV